PLNSAVTPSSGTRCTTSMQTTASALPIDHGGFVMSSSIGSCKFDSAAALRRSAIAATRWGSRSLGCHVRFWNRFAKWTTCSPVPLPTSSPVPDGGKYLACTSPIASSVATSPCYLVDGEPVTQALRDLLRSETDRLEDAGLYKREVVFSRSGGMAAGGMVDGK